MNIPGKRPYSGPMHCIFYWREQVGTAIDVNGERKIVREFQLTDISDLSRIQKEWTVRLLVKLQALKNLYEIIFILITKDIFAVVHTTVNNMVKSEISIQACVA